MAVTDQQKIVVVCAERERAGRTVGEQEIYGEVRERALLLIDLLQASRFLLEVFRGTLIWRISGGQCEQTPPSRSLKVGQLSSSPQRI